MAIKIVPAGDERCDVHNRRESLTHVCETCLKEFGIEYTLPVTTRRGPRRARAQRALRRRRSRIDRKVLIGVGVGLLIVGVISVVVLVAGGGGSGSSGPSEADVVNAIDLVPDPSGIGWVTSDGACAVVSIEFGKDVQFGKEGVGLLNEATNEDGTVGAVVSQNDFTMSEADCVDRVSAALKAHF